MAKKIRIGILVLLFIVILFLMELSYGGKSMRLIECIEGITISVPKNFPQPVLTEEKEAKIVSFSIKPHQDSYRFIHFFEVILTSTKTDVLKRLPSHGYNLGKSYQEDILVNGEKVRVRTIELEISYPCGGKEKTQLYVAEHNCYSKKTFIYILTFTMTKKGFLEIVQTLKCSYTHVGHKL